MRIDALHRIELTCATHLPLALSCATLLTLAGCMAPEAPTASAAVAPGDSALVERRLAGGPDLTPMAVFPDGRRLVITDTTANVAVLDVSTQTATRLTNDGNWAESRQPSLVAAVSRDGEWIAYTMYTNEGGRDYRWDTRIVRVDGTGLRTIHSVSDKCCLSYVHDWSPSGDAVLVSLIGPAGKVSLARISVADGAVRPLLDAGVLRPNGARFSPDGHAVAYALHTETRDSRNIHVLDLDSGSTRVVVDVPESASFVGWGSNASSLYFATGSGELTSLWRQPLKDLAPSGDPQLVRSDLLGVRAMSLTDGRLYFTMDEPTALVRHVILDPVSGNPVSPPETLAGPYEGWIEAFAWSPDAMDLAFTVRSGAWPENDRRIGILSRTTGHRRFFAPSVELLYKPRWEADGLYTRGQSQAGDGIFRMDPGTGEVSAVPTLTALNSIFLPTSSQDGHLRVIVRDNPRRLIVREEPSGAERVILTRDDIGTFALSPDGRWLAALAGERQTAIDLVPTSGGAPKTIYQTTGTAWILGGSMAWSPDSQNVLFLRMADSGEKGIWRVSLDGQAREMVHTGDERSALFFSLSTDGRHIAYSSVLSERRGTEVWEMSPLP